MKKILFILLALSFTLIACKKDDDGGSEECTCTAEAINNDNEPFVYTIPNYPVNCDSGQPLQNSDLLPEGHAIGGCAGSINVN